MCFKLIIQTLSWTLLTYILFDTLSLTSKCNQNIYQETPIDYSVVVYFIYKLNQILYAL